MGAAKEIAKRIPRIKFPDRRASASTGHVQAKQGAETGATNAVPQRISDVPPSPKHQASGGSASIQPHRTPVTDKEIEAIMLGGVF
eukprot:c18041_g1_i1 orf=401-658(-)